MKYFKIIGGFLLLIGVSKEYVNAGKQLLNLFDPSIIFMSLLMLGLCAWLIGSGISNGALKLRSWSFAGYYGASFSIFLIIAFINLLTYKFEPDIVKINGNEIDISEFMNGTQKIIPDETERRNYCVCVVTHLAQNEKIAETYADELAKGRIDKIVMEIQSDPDFHTLNLNECAASLASMKWTAEFERGIRESIMQRLHASPEATTHDLELYCNCLMGEYKKLPASKMSDTDFHTSKQNQDIDSICKTNSFRK